MVASLTFLTPRGGLLGLVALIPLAALAISTLRVRAHRACTSVCRRRGVARPRSPQSSGGRRVRARRARGGSARLAQHRAASRPDGVAGLLRRRRLALDGGRRQALRADAPGPGALRRHPAARRRADGARGSRRADRPGPPVRLPDARRARLPGDPRPLGAHRVAAAPAGQHERDELRGAHVACTRRVLRPRGAAQRTCVLVTDGESRSYSAADVVGALQGPRGCRLVVVRVGGGDERVFGADGSPEAGYTADPAAADRTRALAEAAGGQAFSEADVPAAAAAVRRAAEVGPTGRQQTSATNRALAPYAAALALAAVLALVVLRLREPRLHTDPHESVRFSRAVSPTRRLCRADSGRSGLRDGVRRLVVAFDRDPGGRLAGVRPHAGQQPPLAAHSDHAGERLATRARLQHRLPEDRSRTSAGASSRTPSRSVGAST